VDAAFDEWNIPGLTTVRHEPPASSLSVTAQRPTPSVTREPEIVPAAAMTETLPISGEHATSGLATSSAQSVEGVPRVVEQSVQRSTPREEDFLPGFVVAPLPAVNLPLTGAASEPTVVSDPAAATPPAAPTPLAVPAPPAMSVPLTVLQAPVVPYPSAMSQPLVISETATVPGGESFDIPEASTFSADRWLAGLEQTPMTEPAAPLTTAPTGGVVVFEPFVTEQTTVPEALEAVALPPIESLQISDPLPSAPPAALPSPQMLVSEPAAVVSPALELQLDEDPAPPEADEHGPAPALANEQEAVPLVPSAAAPNPKKKLGAREFALIAMTLLFGGTVTFAMLRASVNRQPAAPAAAPQVAARASKTAARPKSAPAKGAGAHTWTNANRDWVGNQKRAAAFEVLSNNKVAIWTRKAQPILVVRCMAKRTDAFVFIESAAQLETQPNRTVHIRFDDEPESVERWPDSDAHDALFSPDGATFTQRLLNAHTLHFGYTPHNSPQAVAEFNVTGLGAMLAPVAKQCGATK